MTYTPTTESVRKAYAQLMHGWDEENVRYVEETEAREEFNNWHAEELRKAKSEAWHEGFEAGWEEHENPGPFVNDIWDAKTPNPYRSQP